MPYEMIPELTKHAKEEKIIFMSTPFSISDAKEVDPYVPIHKVASFEINHVRLVEFLSASTKKPILISTGASTYDEIDFVVDLVRRKENKNLVLLQCTSKYPCPLEALNLSVIPEMRSRYKIPIGFSDDKHIFNNCSDFSSRVWCYSHRKTFYSRSKSSWS